MWAGILTQTHNYTNTVTQQEQTIDLPITFQSGSYSSSQENGPLYKRKCMPSIQASRKWFSI